MISQCDDNNVGNNYNCGIETTFIQELDNIDSLGNASSSALKIVDDCSYIGVGHRGGVPWATKLNDLGEEVWEGDREGGEEGC